MLSGYVALLDVLGFSEFISADTTDEGVERYLRCLQKVQEETVNYVVFSDNIILTVEGKEADSLLTIASTCSQLMYELLKVNIPIRGAISKGNFIRSSVGKSVFVAGRPVIEAYQFEQVQDWIGIMIAPSAILSVPDLGKRCNLNWNQALGVFRKERDLLKWAAFIQPCQAIPFHATNPFNDSRYDGFAVVPTNGFSKLTKLRDNTREAMDKLNWLRAVAPTPAAQKKYQNTILWLRAVNQLWNDVVNSLGPSEDRSG